MERIIENNEMGLLLFPAFFLFGPQLMDGFASQKNLLLIIFNGKLSTIKNFVVVHAHYTPSYRQPTGLIYLKMNQPTVNETRCLYYSHSYIVNVF